MTQTLDKELKTLMRGQAVDAGPFVWGKNDNLGTATKRVHAVLGLETSNSDLDSVLDLAQRLLMAYGYKLDLQGSALVGDGLIGVQSGFSVSDYITSVLGSVKNDPQLVQLMLERGFLEDFNNAKNDHARLAAVFATLAK